MADMTTNITVTPGHGADPSPTMVAPAIIYAPKTYSIGGVGFGATITSYSAGAYGSLETARLNAAATRANNYIATHVKILADMNNPDDKAVADKIIESIYTTIFNDAINGSKSVGSDPTGNTYNGAELNTLINNMDFTIVRQSSNPNDQAQAATTWASGALSETGHIEIRTQNLIGADQGNIDFVVAHEIAHATPAGHQIANYVAQAWFQNEGQQYLAPNPSTGAMEPTPAYYTAYAQSGYHDVNETWANSFARTIATFDGLGWYHDGANTTPPPGYWHY